MRTRLSLSLILMVIARWSPARTGSATSSCSPSARSPSPNVGGNPAARASSGICSTSSSRSSSAESWRGTSARARELAMLNVTHLSKTYGTGPTPPRPSATSPSRSGRRVRLHRRAVRAAARRRCSRASPACSTRPAARVELDGKRVTGAAREDGPRLPGLQPLAVAVDDRRREHRFPLRRKPIGKRERRQRSTRRWRRRPGRVRGQVPVAALRRHAAARGDRPRPGLPARDAAHGRAVRLRRRADPHRPRGPRPAGSATTTASPSCSSPTTSTRRSTSPTAS